jgi:hypothetical protein
MKKEEEAKLSNNKITCPVCGKEKSLNQFYQSNKQDYALFNGRCFFCKSCLRKMFYKSGIENKENLLMILETKLDLPFIEDVYIQALNEPKETLGRYISLLNMKFKGRTVTWKDSDIEQNSKVKQINNNELDKSNIEEEKEIDANELEELKIKWGKGFSIEQYQRLEDFYYNFASKYETDLPAEVLNFQNAARTQLQIEKALAEGNITLYNSLIKTLSGILGDSNVKPVQATGAEANDQLCWGLFVKKAEEEDPIDTWENDEMKKYIDTYMVGHLAKMEGLHNEFTDMYDNAIKSWSVDFSNLNNDEDEES